MFKNPDEYASRLIGIAARETNRTTAAMQLAFSGAQQFPQVPLQFWVDVTLSILRQENMLPPKED